MAQADAPELPPEFFTNVIKELRRHWVDQEARRLGLDPDSVTRALVLGNTGDAEVRVNDRVRAAVFVGDDQIVDLDETAQLVGERGDTLEIRGLVLDVPPDQPFAFFDLRVGYLLFDYQPRRERAKRHLKIAEQFWHAARDLAARGGLNAACENLFAVAELATMAMMEVSQDVGRNHRSRSEWLRDRGPTLGLSAAEAGSLGVLHQARNAYRYGDESEKTTASPVSLLEHVGLVEVVLNLAREQVVPTADEE